jgi:hypothetical protein
MALATSNAKATKNQGCIRVIGTICLKHFKIKPKSPTANTSSSTLKHLVVTELQWQT